MTLLLTLDEAAEQLRVSRRTVERLIRARHLNPVRIGGRTLIRRCDLEAYIAGLAA